MPCFNEAAVLRPRKDWAQVGGLLGCGSFNEAAVLRPRKAEKCRIGPTPE